MKDNSFENIMKESFHSHEPKLDTDEIWDNIEPKLKKKKKRRFILWIWLGLLGSLFFIGRQINNNLHSSSTTISEANVTVSDDSENITSEKDVPNLVQEQISKTLSGQNAIENIEPKLNKTNALQVSENSKNISTNSLNEVHTFKLENEYVEKNIPQNSNLIQQDYLALNKAPVTTKVQTNPNIVISVTEYSLDPEAAIKEDIVATDNENIEPIIDIIDIAIAKNKKNQASNFSEASKPEKERLDTNTPEKTVEKKKEKQKQKKEKSNPDKKIKQSQGKAPKAKKESKTPKAPKVKKESKAPKAKKESIHLSSTEKAFQKNIKKLDKVIKKKGLTKENKNAKRSKIKSSNINKARKANKEAKQQKSQQNTIHKKNVKLKKKKEQEIRKKEKEKKVIVKKRKPKKWIVETQLSVGPTLPIKMLSANDTDDTNLVTKALLDFRNEHENQLEAFALKWNFNFEYKNGLLLAAGIEYLQLNERFVSELTRVDQISQSVVTEKIENQFGEVVSETRENIELERTTILTQKISNQYRFVNLPIGVGTTWKNGKNKYKILGGIDVNLLFKFKGAFADSRNSPIRTFLFTEEQDDGSVYDSFFKKRTGYGLWLSGEYSRPISKRLNFVVAPRFQFALSPLTNPDYRLRQKYARLTLDIGVSYLLNPVKYKKR